MDVQSRGCHLLTDHPAKFTSGLLERAVVTNHKSLVTSLVTRCIGYLFRIHRAFKDHPSLVDSAISISNALEIEDGEKKCLGNSLEKKYPLVI